MTRKTLIRVLMLTALVCLPLMMVAAQEQTSETDENLAKWLARYPQADTDRDGVLTAAEAAAFREKLKEWRAKQAEYEAGKPAPDYADLAYGARERNFLDLWLAEGDGPRPLVAYIHGGGWVGGDKSTLRRNSLEPLLAAGISVAAINYRYSTIEPFPAPMTDAGRAIQFLRHHAAEYNLDPERFGATGGSAGATTSMCLAYHEDLADPDNEDPVLRQSTRLTCLAPRAGPISLELDVTREWLGAPITIH